MKLRSNLVWIAAAAAVVTSIAVTVPARAGQVVNAGPLSDLSAEANPTDGAQGRLTATETASGGTRIVLSLRGVDPAAAGTTFGAHVHVGPCVAGDGAAAGPHFNTGSGGPPSTRNEVWLDFTVRSHGTAVSRATVPFTIAPGTARSVVIHALPTQHGTGVAGPRIACLPVDF